jgi:hypothetical protein
VEDGVWVVLRKRWAKRGIDFFYENWLIYYDV